jgi:hypothetical protein
VFWFLLTVFLLIAALWLRYELKRAPVVDQAVQNLEAKLPEPAEQLVADATGVHPATAVPVTPKA